MLYLLDANVLIRAHEDYYPLERIPQFWDWLKEMGNDGVIKVPHEIYSEVSIATGPLGKWLNEKDSKNSLLLDEEVDLDLLQYVINDGYATNLTDDEVEKMGRDPFLIAYALDNKNRAVVTKEVSKPTKTRANKKVPDVCNQINVKWMNDFQLYKELDFKIS